MTKKHPPIADKTHSRPNLPNWLFWDVRHEEMDWHECYRYVISRVIDSGSLKEWKEVIQYYGQSMVLHVLRHEARFFPRHIIERICSYFNLKQEELKCCNREPWRKGYWI